MMVNILCDLIPLFPGEANHTRCFNHVVVLITKSSICQFDIPKGQADVALDEAESKLRELAEGLDIEEQMTEAKWDEPDERDNDNTDGWVDEVACLLVADWEELEENIRPVKLVLVKVSHESVPIMLNLGLPGCHHSYTRLCSQSSTQQCFFYPCGSKFSICWN